jgi:hypothetical protein
LFQDDVTLKKILSKPSPHDPAQVAQRRTMSTEMTVCEATTPTSTYSYITYAELMRPTTDAMAPGDGAIVLITMSGSFAAIKFERLRELETSLYKKMYQSVNL